MNSENKLSDKSGDRKYFILTQRIVWALCDDPYDYTLWSVIKDIAGESGECYLSTPDLATLSMMSAGRVSKSRLSLIDKKLLRGEIRRDPGYPQPVWHLEIPDLWEQNIAWCLQYPGLKERIDYKKSFHHMNANENDGEPSPHEGGVSPDEGGTTPDETKNNSKKNQIENKNGAETAPLQIDPSDLPLDWQVAAVTSGKMDASQITLPDAEREFQALVDLSAFELVQKGGAHLESLHRAFMVARRIIPNNAKQLKGWRVAYQQMYDAKMNRVRPEHITEAVQQLLAIKYTVADPFSIIDNAISLANPVEVQNPNERVAVETY